MLEVEYVEPTDAPPTRQDEAGGHRSSRAALVVVAGVAVSLALLVILNWK